MYRFADHFQLKKCWYQRSVSLSAPARYGAISFDNGLTRAGNTVVREDGDRSFLDLELNTSYEILPNHRPFITLNIGATDYKNKTFTGGSFSGPERDSKNYNGLLGWALSYKGLVQGFFGIGYGKRNYDDAAIDDIGSTRISSNINWNVTKKATLNLSLRRAVTEDNQIVQGIILTQGRMQLDYEVLHNLYYKAFIDYALADFQTSTRQDDVILAGTGLRYHINPRFSFSGDYSYQQRDTTAVGLNYDSHEFVVRLHTRF